MSLSAGTHIGPYEIEGAIGAGGMGEVYRAHDTKLKRVVALKVLPEQFAKDPERLARFQRESEVLASLNHPNIAQVFGLEDSDSGPVIAMEFVDGPTLADRLQQGALALEDALAIARQIAEAIEYAHERGVIHRDLKPANIKLTTDGGVKVLDFGLAKAIDQGSGIGDQGSGQLANSPTITSPAMTMRGIILGTAAYMSPEQAKGIAVDRRADIWAFGVVLFEMLSGRALYGGETASETMAQVMMKEPDWSLLPASTPARVRELLKRCLVRDPKRRLQAIGEARIAIDDAANGPAPADVVIARRPAAWRERAAIVALVVFVVLSAALASMLYRRQPAAAPAVVQFEVETPGQIATAPALSPDGTMMAFGINDGQGINVWIHSFASGKAAPLAGAEGYSPAVLIWSPDSRAIAFSSRGKLKRVDLESHAVQVICDLPSNSPARASWGSDGIIVLGGADSGIGLVSAAGGEVTPLIALRDEGSLTAPSFLPDGRHFFFQSRGTLKAYWGTVGSPDRHELPGVTSEVKFDPSGHVLYIHNGALVAQRFDPDRLAVSGERVVIADGFTPGILGGLYSLSDTGVLARTATSIARSQLTWVDRRGTAIGPAGPPGEYGDIELSLDDRYVAYEAGGPAADIWVLDIANGVNSRVTSNPVRDADPVWSPDGKTIAFRGDRDGGHLYRRSFGQVGDDQLLLPSTDRDSPSSWSTDGRYLLFDRNRGNDIWALPIGADAKPIQVTDSKFQEREGQLSPDGRLIAFESDESGTFEVYVQAFPGPGMKRQISSGGPTHTARWSRDGKELFYVARQTLTAVPISTSGTSFSIGAASALFSTTDLAGEGAYAVAKDGRFLINVVPRSTPHSTIGVTWNWRARLPK